MKPSRNINSCFKSNKLYVYKFSLEIQLLLNPIYITTFHTKDRLGNKLVYVCLRLQAKILITRLNYSDPLEALSRL